MITIRPATIPAFHLTPMTNPTWGVKMAWVVNEEVVVYLEKSDNTKKKSILSFIPIEKGIGGRLIEPTFTSVDNFIRRTDILGYPDDGGDPIESLKTVWAERFP